MTNNTPHPTVAADSALTDIFHHPIARRTKTRGWLLLITVKSPRAYFINAGKRPLAILILQKVAPAYSFEIYMESKKPQERMRIVGFEPTTLAGTTPLWTS